MATNDLQERLRRPFTEVFCKIVLFQQKVARLRFQTISKPVTFSLCNSLVSN